MFTYYVNHARNYMDKKIALENVIPKLLSCDIAKYRRLQSLSNKPVIVVYDILKLALANQDKYSSIEYLILILFYAKLMRTFSLSSDTSYDSSIATEK